MAQWTLQASGASARDPGARPFDPVRFGIFEELGLIVLARAHGSLHHSSPIAAQLIQTIKRGIEPAGATLADALRNASRQLLQRPKHAQASASVLALHLRDETAHVAFAGSCRLGRIRDGLFAWLTVPNLLRYRFSEQEVSQLPEGIPLETLLTNMLGISEPQPLTEQQWPVQQDDRFILCSAGAARHIHDGPMPVTGSLQTQAQSWVERSLAAGSAEASCVIAHLG